MSPVHPPGTEMNFQYLILPELRCIAARYTGEVSAEDIMNASRQLWADPLYDKSYIGISDLSRAAARAQASDIPALVSYYRNTQASSGRWAVVVSEPKSTALSLLFKAATFSQPWIEIFTSWESACAFLHVDIPASLFDKQPGPALDSRDQPATE